MHEVEDQITTGDFLRHRIIQSISGFSQISPKLVDYRIILYIGYFKGQGHMPSTPSAKTDVDP